MSERGPYSHVILGGGTAGCVLAGRLSERPSNRVLLVEAGMDTPPGRTPADILDPYPLSYANPNYRWPLRGHAQTGETSPESPLLQASVMGGGSSIMGMIMLRGAASDYDGWAGAGAEGWAWKDVLPWFRALETDLDYGDAPLHGAGGPTPIRRHDPNGWPAIALAARRYAEHRGLPFIADLNADFRDGLGALPIAGGPSERSSAASAYLTASVRARSNLEILDRTRATALMFEGRRVVGAALETTGGRVEARAGTVVLSMGALLTPHFLMTNGIGDPDGLAAAGRPVRVALPGVGRNLQNHAALVLLAHLRAHAVQARPQRNHNDAMIRYSSGLADCPPSDMALMFGSRTSWHAVARRLAHFSPVIMQPMSRGQVSLGADRAPIIAFNLLGDPRDEARLLQGLDRVAALLASREMAGLTGVAVGGSKLGKAAGMNARTRANAIRAAVIAAAMDRIPGFGSLVLGSLASEGDTIAALAADPDRARAFLRRAVQPLAHHAGTCRMGRADDPLAVVDPAGRVRGMEGLRVVDASVMPTIPRANTNLPVLMIAEKLAGHMLEG